MNTIHPFLWIKKKSQLPVFIGSFIVTLFIIVGMQFLGRPLVTKAAPSGIVSFEFAGDLETSQTIIASWGQETTTYAGLNLGFDYLFMVGYGVTIGLGCILISSKLKDKINPLSFLGIFLAWGSILAALLDALENYALIRILLGSINELWPPIAKWCAGVKFFLVAIGIGYILLGVLYLLIANFRKEAS